MAMWALSGKREVFLDVVTRLSRGELLDPHQVEPEENLLPRPGEISLVWGQPPRTPIDLPEIIIGDEKSLEDLVAWANSYVRGIGAISSNCRLLFRDDIALLSPKEPYARPAHSTAVAGLVVAEVLALSDGTKSIGDIGISACLSTFAFACARAQFLLHPAGARTRLAERWERAHRATNPTTTISSDLVREIVETCSYVLDFAQSGNGNASEPEIITGALSRLARDGEISRTLLTAVLRPFRTEHAESHRLDAMFGLTPTDRVRIFDDLSPIIRRYSERSRTERAFALAVLASACRPGTLQHFGLLRHSADLMPEAMLWFGAIQGLHRHNDVLESADGLGRRILRELFQKESIADRPRSDIASLELDILARGSSLRSLRTSSSSYISIEIAPAVYTVAKWRPAPPVPSAEDLQKELPLRRDRDPAEELEATLRCAMNLIGEIRRPSRSVEAENTRKGKRSRR